MLFAAFLPLVILGLFTTDAAGTLAFLPCTSLTVWFGISAATVFWTIPERLDRLIRDDRFEELIVAQNRLPWLIAFWVLLLHAVSAPAALFAPGLLRWFPQFLPLTISAIAFVTLLWSSFRPFHRGFRAMLLWEQTPGEYLRARLSAPILIFPPLLVGALLEDVSSWITIIPGLSDLPLIVFAPLFCVGLYIFSPKLFNWAWQAEPLKEKPEMAAQILDMAAKTETPIAGIRVWNTFKEPVPNAAVVGLLPSYRYVYLTRYLLETFPEREQIVIVAHELGHFRLGHVWTYLWFSFVLVFLSLATRLLIFLHWPRLPEMLSSWWTVPLELGGFLGCFLVLFTALSRFGEHQADCFAADLIGKSEITDAMQRLASELRPASKRFPWWMETHPDFPARIAFILAWTGTRETLIRSAWQWRRGMMLAVGLGLALLLPTFTTVWDIGRTAQGITSDTSTATDRRLEALQCRLGGHPVLDELAAKRAFFRGGLAEGVMRTAALWVDVPAPTFHRRASVSEVFQHPGSPEVTLHLEIMHFLLQSLDLGGVHRIPLFDHVLDFVQISFSQG
ncbi:MAG: M48 family metalloprotease [Candidatus Ozemobacteraceae bacterium]